MNSNLELHSTVYKEDLPQSILNTIWKEKLLSDYTFTSAEKSVFIDASLSGYISSWKQREKMSYKGGHFSINRRVGARAILDFVELHSEDQLSMWIIVEINITCLYAEKSDEVLILPSWGKDWDTHTFEPIRDSE
jgi:hypothetical protein